MDFVIIAKIGKSGKHWHQTKKTNPTQFPVGRGTVALSAKPGKSIRRKKHQRAMGPPMFLNDQIQRPRLCLSLGKLTPQDGESLFFQPVREKTELIEQLPIGRFAGKRTTLFGIDQPAHTQPPLRSGYHPGGIQSLDHSHSLGGSLGQGFQSERFRES